MSQPRSSTHPPSPRSGPRFVSGSACLARLLLHARLGAALLVAAAGTFVGCEAGGEHDHEAHAEGTPLFEVNKGIRLPPEMRRDLGIETEELRERTLSLSRPHPAQVFRAGLSNRPAAALLRLAPAEARQTPVGTRLDFHPPGPNQTGDVATANVVLVDPASAVFSDQAEVVLEWPDPAGRWAPGSPLTVLLPVPRTNGLPTVATAAVIDSAQGAFVYAVSGEHFVRTPVKTGASDGTHVEVLEGLYAGDEVVTRGVDTLWMIELSALKGGTPCCPVPLKKGRE